MLKPALVVSSPHRVARKQYPVQHGRGMSQGKRMSMLHKGTTGMTVADKKVFYGSLPIGTFIYYERKLLVDMLW